jgi:hypothetical protein
MGLALCRLVMTMRGAAGRSGLLLLAACLLGVYLSGTAHAQEAPGETAADTPSEASEADAAPTGNYLWFDHVIGSGQWFWTQNKAMPGIELGLGRGLVEFDFELSFVVSTQRSRDWDGTLLGNQLGAYLMLTPLRQRYVDLSLGLGGDFYLLWGIHSEASEAALVPRVALRLWPLERLGITLTARTYLFPSRGLELGTRRDGSEAPAFLLSSGITWKFL